MLTILNPYVTSHACAVTSRPCTCHGGHLATAVTPPATTPPWRSPCASGHRHYRGGCVGWRCSGDGRGRASGCAVTLGHALSCASVCASGLLWRSTPRSMWPFPQLLTVFAAMQQKPDGDRSRQPTDRWSGWYFSKSMPGTQIRERLSKTQSIAQEPRPQTHYEVGFLFFLFLEGGGGGLENNFAQTTFKIHTCFPFTCLMNG